MEKKDELNSIGWSGYRFSRYDYGGCDSDGYNQSGYDEGGYQRCEEYNNNHADYYVDTEGEGGLDLEQASYYPESGQEWVAEDWGGEEAKYPGTLVEEEDGSFGVSEASIMSSPAAVTAVAVKAKTDWRPPWATRWKRRNCIPWKCTVCSHENKYKVERCVQCGKTAPVGANLRLEDAAATLVQNMCRRALSRALVRQACLQRYVRRFDAKKGKIHYQDRITGAKLESKPILIHDDSIVAMDEREEVQYNEYLADKKYKTRLKNAFMERESKRNVERAAKRQREKHEAYDAWEAKWHASFVGTERNGELIANWQGFTADDLHPQLWELGPKIVLLRFIGNPLRYLPGSLCLALTSLTVLSLSNCELTELPAEFTSITLLEDLNLMYNSLTELPSNFGRLNNLTALHLASNQLKTLPDSFKELQALPRLNLEQNPITCFPENIVELNCKIISWSKMSLKQLPRNLETFGMTLVSLTADHNRLRRIPKGVGKLRNLKHLSLCNNQLRNIPDELCECIALERLWLDWNKIKELPPDFLRLVSLQSIHVEGNPIQTPDMEIVVAGVPTLKAWFKDSVAFYTAKERKKIVVQLQSMLATMHEEGLHIDEYYEPGCTTDAIGEKRDLYHALTPGYLFNHVIPRWNKFVDDLGAEGTQRPTAKLQQYSLERHKAEKLDQEKFARLENLVLNQMESISRDLEATESSESLIADQPVDETLDAKSEAVAMAAKDKEELEHRRMLAELEDMQKIEDKNDDEARMRRVHHELKKVRRFLEPFPFTEKEVANALEHTADNYGKIFVHNQTVMFRRCRCMRNSEPRLCVPPNELFRCKRSDVTLIKISLVTYLERLRRNSLNAEETKLAKRSEKIEQEGREYASTQEGNDFFSSVAIMKAAEILEEERKQRHILKYRIKLETKQRKQRFIRQARKERLIKAIETHKRGLEVKRAEAVGILERSRGWEAQEVQNKIMEIDDEIDNPPQEMELELLEKEDEAALEKHAFLTSRDQALSKYKSEFGLFSEMRETLLKPLKKRAEIIKRKLVDAYVESHKKEAILAVRREYRKTRRIMFNWMNLNVKTTFFAWKEFTQSQVYWKKRLAREEACQQALANADNKVQELYTQMEFMKWTEHVDRFSDLPYWQHCETGEIVWEAPHQENCVYVPRVGVKKPKHVFKVLPDYLEEETKQQDELFLRGITAQQPAESSEPEHG